MNIMLSRSFQVLQEEGTFCADRTAHLEKFLDTPAGTFLFTRRQGFGTTLFLGMVLPHVLERDGTGRRSVRPCPAEQVRAGRFPEKAGPVVDGVRSKVRHPGPRPRVPLIDKDDLPTDLAGLPRIAWGMAFEGEHCKVVMRQLR